MDTSIFKAYDIRGVYPETINKEVAYKIGYAFSQIVGGETVCIGSDMRISGPEIKKALFQGLSNGGLRIIDIGLVSTDMLTFAVGRYGYDGGIMITASHNPSQYSGMKMVAKNAVPISSEYKLFEIRDYALTMNQTPEKTEIDVEKKDIWQDWVNHVLSFVNKEEIKPFKIAVDAGNGMAGKVIPYFAKALPQLEIEEMYFIALKSFSLRRSDLLNIMVEGIRKESVVTKKRSINPKDVLG